MNNAFMKRDSIALDAADGAKGGAPSNRFSSSQNQRPLSVAYGGSTPVYKGNPNQQPSSASKTQPVSNYKAGSIYQPARKNQPGGQKKRLASGSKVSDMNNVFMKRDSIALPGADSAEGGNSGGSTGISKTGTSSNRVSTLQNQGLPSVLYGSSTPFHTGQPNQPHSSVNKNKPVSKMPSARARGPNTVGREKPRAQARIKRPVQQLSSTLNSKSASKMPSVPPNMKGGMDSGSIESSGNIGGSGGLGGSGDSGAMPPADTLY
ncbi:hypothetical protein MMC10_009726 [Thelotrema lepadinum]|nr:hypothetical protein [Thelotrema lepadinum]